MTTFGDWVDWFLGRQIPHSQLLSEKKSLLISINDEKNKVKALEVDVTKLSRVQERFTDEINTLKNELKEKKLQIQKLDEERKIIEQQHESTEKTLNEKVLKLNSVHNTLVQMRLSQRSLNKKELEHITLVEQHKTLENKFETLETRTRMLQKVICEKEMTAGSYEEKDEELQINNKQIETELASLQENKKRNEMDLTMLQEKNAQLSASLNEVEQSKAKLCISKTSKDQVESTGPFVAGDIVENPS